MEARGNEPKELIPWLEEFVIMGKWAEDNFFIRADAGNEPQQHQNAAQRHRLEAEAALWKAKNAQEEPKASSGPDDSLERGRLARLRPGRPRSEKLTPGLVATRWGCIT